MIDPAGRPSPATRTTLFDRIKLNDRQREAVVYDSGPQLVFAGAGTGKTRVLTTKIAYLIEDLHIAPNRIFAATFTNKAAREMKARVESLTGIPCAGLWIGTFHSLCARILRREAHRIGYARHFSIYDSDDQISLIKKVMKELQIDERSMTPASVLRAISRHKNACTPPEKLVDTGKSYYEREVIRVYVRYQERLKEQQAMDFDDLISNTVYLMRNGPELLRSYQELFSYVLVDEYQDTNLAQFYLVRHLAESHGRIFVVGDDDQSIYGWRGAQIDNILSFDRVFTNTKVFKLQQNYRSTRPILEFANAAIAVNAHRAAKELWTSEEHGEKVVVTHFADDRQEANEICDEIDKLRQDGVALTDIMVLFRTNAQSRSFEDAMRKRNIPYMVVGGVSFYERREIKDCLAYLRLVVNRDDDIAFARIMNVPARGLGQKSYEGLVRTARGRGLSLLACVLDGVEGVTGRARKAFDELQGLFSELTAMYERNEQPQDILKTAIKRSGYLDMYQNDGSEEAAGRVENINELVNTLAIWAEENPERSLADMLEEISLVADVDSLDDSEGRVPLMTLHSAKGLEARYVFVAGLEDGIIPSRQNFDDERRIEEERRLFYVGVTRGIERVMCSHATLRWRFGSIVPMTPSRFLEAVPESLYLAVDRTGTFREPVMEYRTQKPRREPREIPQEQPRYDEFSQETVQFRMGQHVRHKVYGIGRIISISGFGQDMRLSVLFNDGQRRRMMAKFAKLETL